MQSFKNPRVLSVSLNIQKRIFQENSLHANQFHEFYHQMLNIKSMLHFLIYKTFKQLIDETQIKRTGE